MGDVRQFLEFPGGRGGVTASSLKWKIRRGGGVLYDIPSVVGVWIFSGTTQCFYKLISFYKTFLCPSFIDRGSRKAHPKAAQLGGSKKVEGLKSKVKQTKLFQQVSSEELSLFARLDELEEKEAENAELDQLWKDDFDYGENKTEIGYAQKGDDKRSALTQSENTNPAKKVTWETLDNKNDAVVNSSDSSESDNDSGDEDIQRTISVRFSSSSTLLKGQVNNSLLCCSCLLYGIYMICLF